MKHAFDMGSGVMIYIPSFMKIGSAIQMLGEGGCTETWRGDHLSLLSYFQNKESRLKNISYLSTVGLHGKLWNELAL
jgi:hypothetical protein